MRVTGSSSQCPMGLPVQPDLSEEALQKVLIVYIAVCSMHAAFYNLDYIITGCSTQYIIMGR